MVETVGTIAIIGAAYTLSLGVTEAKPADSEDRAEIAKVVDAQIEALDRDPDAAERLYLPDAKIVVTNESESSIGGSADPGDLPIRVVNNGSYHGKWTKDRTITLARDGKSAWFSATSRVSIKYSMTDGGSTEVVPYRITNVLVKTAQGWKIAAGAWSKPRANSQVNKAAMAGKLDKLEKIGMAGGDNSLRDVFAKMTTDGVDALAVGRKDLVAFGSGPGERTVGGAPLAKAWNAAWAKHMEIDGDYFAGVTPSDKTGWVSANVVLAKTQGKTSYKVPFRLFLVFDKNAKGAWGLVQAHFATRS